jgi:hypothetical protein
LLVAHISTIDILLNLVEELCGITASLCVEWTGITCWHKDSSIPPHYDR